MGLVDRSVVVIAFLGFVVATEMDPDQPSAVTSCNDLSNFASHRVFLLGSEQRHTNGAPIWRQTMDITVD